LDWAAGLAAGAAGADRRRLPLRDPVGNAPADAGCGAGAVAGRSDIP